MADSINDHGKLTALVVEDVSVVRIPIKSALKKAGFNVLEADSAEKASAIIESTKVDFITLDLHLPGVDGGTWLKTIRAAGVNTPVVIVTGSTEDEANLIYDALNSGAQEFFEKDKLSHEVQRLAAVAVELTKPRSFVSRFKPTAEADRLENQIRGKIKLIAIGGGTGGPEALWDLMRSFQTPSPPIILAQHMNLNFARHFAETLIKVSGLKIGYGAQGESLKENHIYLPLENRQIFVRAEGDKLCLSFNEPPRDVDQLPSIDKLFESIAEAKTPSVGILLSGIGDDGVSGLLKMKNTGICYNMTQDSVSSVAREVPEKAQKAGAVHFVGSVDAIRSKLFDLTMESIEQPERLKA